MSEYIKREDVIKKMYYEAFDNNVSYMKNMAKWDSGLWIRYKLFENVIETIPSVDVVEPKRGEWVAKTENYYSHWVCSKCGAWALLEYNEQMCLSNFCPNCGADMRKESE